MGPLFAGYPRRRAQPLTLLDSGAAADDRAREAAQPHQVRPGYQCKIQRPRLSDVFPRRRRRMPGECCASSRQRCPKLEHPLQRARRGSFRRKRYPQMLPSKRAASEGIYIAGKRLLCVVIQPHEAADRTRAVVGRAEQSFGHRQRPTHRSPPTIAWDTHTPISCTGSSAPAGLHRSAARRLLTTRRPGGVLILRST
jgi:hypothetical protein